MANSRLRRNTVAAKVLRKQIRVTLYSAVGVGLGLVLVYWLWFDVFNGISIGVDSGAWGTFGDFIGGIMNPIVAGCALFWLTRSVQMQKEELSATKQELAESREAQQDQAKTLDRQRFEDTFFALLDQHNIVLNSLNAPVDRYGGLSLAQEFHRKVRTLTLAQAKAVLDSYDYQYGHYFRVLYQLLKLVATRCPSSTLSTQLSAEEIQENPVHEDEKLYTNIIRSFINVDLSQMLAINCFCDVDSSYWKYKCLVERYAFLEHMPFRRGIHAYPALRETASFYAKQAFGDSDYLRGLSTAPNYSPAFSFAFHIQSAFLIGSYRNNSQWVFLQYVPSKQILKGIKVSFSCFGSPL